ncbi:MAG: BolA family protein [Nitrospiria bacterium]
MSATSEATKEKIERKMNEQLSATYVEIIDESWKHAGHAGAASGGGHFILLVVANRFEGTSLLDRNRMVFDLLKEEMKGEIHALAVKAMTPQEWNEKSLA